MEPNRIQTYFRVTNGPTNSVLYPRTTTAATLLANLQTYISWWLAAIFTHSETVVDPVSVFFLCT